MPKILKTEDKNILQVNYMIGGTTSTLYLGKGEREVYVPINSADKENIISFWGTIENFQNDLKKFLTEQNK